MQLCIGSKRLQIFKSTLIDEASVRRLVAVSLEPIIYCGPLSKAVLNTASPQQSRVLLFTGEIPRSDLVVSSSM